MLMSWEMVMAGLKGCRTSTKKGPEPSPHKSNFDVDGDLDRGLRDKDLSSRGKDQRLRKNRLVSNGDQVLVMTLDVQVAVRQNDDVGDDVE
jgi:hypothetical protein